MKTIFVVFKFEWYYLMRSRLSQCILLLLFFCAAYSIYYGNTFTVQQLRNIELVKSADDSTKNTFYRFFADPVMADSLRFGFAGMNSLYDGFTTEEFLENNVAINHPHKLSHLSIGQRDIYPIFRKVTARCLFYDGGGISFDDKYIETRNPAKSLAGNFDLGFVFIYLFPLVIIAITYNTLSAEKENGTYPLVRNLPVAFKFLIAYRLLFWMLVIFGMSVIFTIAGILFSPVPNAAIDHLIFYWFGVTFLYVLFWFALVWFVISFGKSSAVNALLLIGSWLLFLVVTPALVNNYISARYKISSRKVLTARLNDLTSNLWESNDSVALSEYYKDYPEFAINSFKPLWTAADSYDSLGKREDADIRYNKKLILWHYYLNKKIKTPVAAFNRQLEEKLSAADRFLFVNPVSGVQEAFNDAAMSGYRQHIRYREATSRYRDSIFNITNRFVFGERKLSLADYQSYPDFEIDRFGNALKKDYSVFYILLFYAIAFVVAGIIKFRLTA
jgi:ABC-2 type transport system permease protein